MEVREAAVWKSKLPIVSCCGRVTPPAVFISDAAEAKVQALMQRMGTCEWMAWLIGEARPDSIVVEDLEVPEQVVTAASVEVVASDVPARCVGVMHSHHDMGAFFSKTDDDATNPNVPVSIVVARKNGGLEWRAMVRVALPCGYYLMTEAPVRRLFPTVPAGWVAQAMARIHPKRPALAGSVAAADAYAAKTLSEEEAGYEDICPECYGFMTRMRVQENEWLVCTRCGATEDAEGRYYGRWMHPLDTAPATGE